MTRYHPDDDGGQREWDELEEKRYLCCGGRDCHRLDCPYEDEEEDEFPPEDF